MYSYQFDISLLIDAKRLTDAIGQAATGAGTDLTAILQQQGLDINKVKELAQQVQNNGQVSTAGNGNEFFLLCHAYLSITHTINSCYPVDEEKELTGDDHVKNLANLGQQFLSIAQGVIRDGDS